MRSTPSADRRSATLRALRVGRHPNATFVLFRISQCVFGCVRVVSVAPAHDGGLRGDAGGPARRLLAPPGTRRRSSSLSPRLYCGALLVASVRAALLALLPTRAQTLQKKYGQPSYCVRLFMDEEARVPLSGSTLLSSIHGSLGASMLFLSFVRVCVSECVVADVANACGQCASTSTA